jgi:hypothetical protein
VYTAYAAMDGRIATTTPGTHIDAYATVASDKKEARILVGDDQSGTPAPATLDVSGTGGTNLADGQGRVRVVVQRASRTAPAGRPAVLSPWRTPCKSPTHPAT